MWHIKSIDELPYQLKCRIIKEKGDGINELQNKEKKAKEMKKNKFNAVKTIINNIKFDSKREAKRFNELEVLKRNGIVNFFFRQVSFDLPGNLKYKLDFLVFWKDGKITFEDVKGMRIRTSMNKIKQVEDIYNIKIDLI